MTHHAGHVGRWEYVQLFLTGGFSFILCNCWSPSGGAREGSNRYSMHVPPAVVSLTLTTSSNFTLANYLTIDLLIEIDKLLEVEKV